MNEKKIILALDTPKLDQLKSHVETLFPFVSCFKIGLEAMTTFGAKELVRLIHDNGGNVFLDGKFCDIPNTVAKASKEAANLGVKMFNVHASCGKEALEAANENKGKSLLLAVTVLTSMDEKTSKHVFGLSSKEAVLKFAFDALKAGCDGVVCSGQDLDTLSKHDELKSLLKVTPGIRPSFAQSNDQKRILTPLEALKKGATHLVIGRPITEPPEPFASPLEAIKNIYDEIHD